MGVTEINMTVKSGLLPSVREGGDCGNANAGNNIYIWKEEVGWCSKPRNRGVCKDALGVMGCQHFQGLECSWQAALASSFHLE